MQNCMKLNGSLIVYLSIRRTIRFKWIRNWTVWKYFVDYFPAELVRTVELSPNTNYLFAIFPHGILRYVFFLKVNVMTANPTLLSIPQFVRSSKFQQWSFKMAHTIPRHSCQSAHAWLSHVVANFPWICHGHRYGFSIGTQPDHTAQPVQRQEPSVEQRWLHSECGHVVGRRCSRSHQCPSG